MVSVLADVRDVRTTTALRNKPAARLERGVDRREQLRVIADPVQRRVAEGQVGNLVEAQVFERALQVFDAVAELRLEVLASGFKHVARSVDGDHAAAWQTP